MASPKQAEMNIKRSAPQLNKLRIPIYSMEAFANYIYFGGGGGYEIKNQIVGYKIESGAQFLT